MEKYFLHRIQKESGAFSKGIEIHDTLESAVLSYWGRVKLAYGKSPAITFMSCRITDGSGNVVGKYNMKWKTEEEDENKFFLHYIRLDGETFSKDIDILDSFDTARADFAAQMEYGYENVRHPNVTFVSCCITDLFSGEVTLANETWELVVEPEPEPEPEPENVG